MLNVIRKLWPELLDETINPKYETLPLKEVNCFLKDNNLDVVPIVVHTQRRDGVLEARCEIFGEYFTGEVEYAFYLIANGKRIDMKWYAAESYTSFELTDATRNANLKIKGFVRERQNPNHMVSTTVQA
jgi:hypothetical protein